MAIFFLFFLKSEVFYFFIVYYLKIIFVSMMDFSMVRRTKPDNLQRLRIIRMMRLCLLTTDLTILPFDIPTDDKRMKLSSGFEFYLIFRIFNVSVHLHIIAFATDGLMP